MSVREIKFLLLQGKICLELNSIVNVVLQYILHKLILSQQTIYYVDFFSEIMK